MKTDKLIREMELFIETIPKNLKIYVFQTDSPEDLTKTHFDLPQYWTFKTFYNAKNAEEAFNYFVRKGYNSKKSFFLFAPSFSEYGDNLCVFAYE